MRISVIIPTHNRTAPLQRLLESLFTQQYDRQRFEIIVVNDGSTDGTGELLRSVARTHGVRWIEIPNSGSAIARNRGAQEAQGEILAFTDDDCVCPPNWLQSIEAELRNRGAVRFSIIIPTYNRMERLKECLAAVLCHDVLLRASRIASAVRAFLRTNTVFRVSGDSRSSIIPNRPWWSWSA